MTTFDGLGLGFIIFWVTGYSSAEDQSEDSSS